MEGSSCINTRLSFDTEVLVPNLTKKDYRAMNINQSFKGYKRHDLKVVHSLKLDGETKLGERRIIAKILKLVVDIEFDKKNATERELLYNEIFPPAIEKKKVLDADERSTYQLFDMFDTTVEGKPKTYNCTPKSHATMFPKKFIPLYLEDLRFLIKRAGWRMTKLYSHFEFEQDAFKKEFVLMIRHRDRMSKTTSSRIFSN